MEKLMMDSVRSSLSKIYNKISCLIAFWNYIFCKIKVLKGFEKSLKKFQIEKEYDSIFSDILYRICGVAASIQ